MIAAIVQEFVNKSEDGGVSCRPPAGPAAICREPDELARELERVRSDLGNEVTSDSGPRRAARSTGIVRRTLRVDCRCSAAGIPGRKDSGSMGLQRRPVMRWALVFESAMSPLSAGCDARAVCGQRWPRADCGCKATSTITFLRCDCDQLPALGALHRSTNTSHWSPKGSSCLVVICREGHGCRWMLASRRGDSRTLQGGAGSDLAPSPLTLVRETTLREPNLLLNVARRLGQLCGNRAATFACCDGRSRPTIAAKR